MSIRRVGFALAAGLMALSLTACVSEGDAKPSNGHVSSSSQSEPKVSSIGEMKVGDTGYVEASAMKVDANSYGWLESNFPVREKDPRRTSTMRIERRADGYHVWPSSKAAYVVGGIESTSGRVAVATMHVASGEVKQLPAGLQARSVDDMEVGEVGYVRASRLKLDGSGSGYLSGTMLVSDHASPLTMRIERRADGYHVWTRPVKPMTISSEPVGRKVVVHTVATP